jgi:GNAT superfamily N-acetyltransferase
MFDFQIRHATQHDFAAIIRFVQAMLSEMYALNTHAPPDYTEAWLDFESRIVQTLRCEDDGAARYLCAANHLLEIAETIGGDAAPIGLIDASILPPAAIFRPARTLHIHALYVLPTCRRRGVGAALLRATIDWGQEHQCLRAQLSVLPHNPARRLYQALGFTAFGLEMRKELARVNASLFVQMVDFSPCGE